MTSLSAADVRRIAATAPFAPRGADPACPFAPWGADPAGPAPAPITGALDALRALGAIQLDPMSRVERAHRLTVLARIPAPRAGRLGAPAALDAELWQPGEAAVFEGEVHALCVLPIDAWPLHRERHEAAARRLDDHPGILAEWGRVERLVGESAAGLTLGELELAKSRTSGWNYSTTKHAVEFGVAAGLLIVSERRAGQRVFDLPERRIPAPVLAARLDADGIADALMERALRVLGVGTLGELARHVRLAPVRAAAALDRLAAAGAARPVEIDDEDAGGSLASARRGTRRSSQDGSDEAAPWVSTAALAALDAPAPTAVRWVGPFDNLLWDRGRIARLFGLDYRLEAYTPKEQRMHGPYALVALVGDRMVGRIDVRAVRRAGVLRVEGFTPEPGRVPFARLRDSLPGFARALGLAEVRGIERLARS